MAVVWVHKTFDRTGKKQTPRGVQSKRNFQVLTDDAADDDGVVLSAVDPATSLAIPARFSVHPGNSSLRVDRVSSRPNRNQPFLHEVTVEYNSLQLPEEDQEKLVPNPLDRNPTVEFFFVAGREPARIGRPLLQTFLDNDPDILEVPIVNSAGQSFQDTMFIDASRPAVRITRNEANFDVTRAMQFTDAVNLIEFMGVSTGRAKMMNIRGRGPFQENGIKYIRVTYEIHFRPLGWIIEHLDEGFMEVKTVNPFDPGQPELVPATDGFGNPVTSPVPLDGFGNKLVFPRTATPGSPEYMDALVQLSWGPYPLKDFGELGLGV